MSTEQSRRIGKVLLDLSKYGGSDLYCDGAVEDEILEIVKTTAASDYPRAIKEHLSWPVLYHLSDIRENIVEWIPIKPGSRILEVGAGCGAISGVLSRKAGTAGRLDCVELSEKRSLINAYRHRDAENICIHVGNFEDIEPAMPADYDAIFLIGVFEYAAAYIHDEDPYGSFLRIIKKHVRPGGSIIIAIENRLGMKYFGGAREDHLGDYFSGIEDYPSGGVVRTFSRPALERLLAAEGLTDHHFYYPYPDYKFMQYLYSDRRLPREGELSVNHLKLDRDRMELFDEQLAYDSMIRDGLYPLFSNSYLLICGPEPELVYSKYSNDRAAAYVLRTDIEEDEKGVRRVYKRPMGEEAKEHVSGISRREEGLRKRYEGTGLSVCPCEKEGDALRFPFLEGPTMEEELERVLKSDDREGALSLLRTYRDFVYHKAEEGPDNPDMQFSNLILCDGTWQLIDYEWAKEEAGDPEKNLIRGLYLFREYNASGKKLTEELLSEAYPELSLHFDIDALRATERAFQKSVTGTRPALGEWNELLAHAAHKPQEERTAPPAAAAETEESSAPERHGLKAVLQGALHASALRSYETELQRQKEPYTKPAGGGMVLSESRQVSKTLLIPYDSACAEMLDTKADFLIFADRGGALASGAVRGMEHYFSEHEDCLWLYTDEDLCDEECVLCFPYYKPDWSPETFLSSFYIGSLVAVRSGPAGAALAGMKEDCASLKGLPFLYALCLQLAEAEPPAHIREVLYHKSVKKAELKSLEGMLLSDAPGGGEEFIPLKESFLSRKKIGGRFVTDGDGTAYPLYDLPKGRVSILILSKDQPELLRNCVSSIREKSSFKDYEILVADNGSCEAKRKQYEALAREYDLRYLYEKADFNFSALCNRIAGEAYGSWFLFLNDDTELLTGDWLERMLGQAAQPGIGAVGAKLYYPGGGRDYGYRIQHCGIQKPFDAPRHRLAGVDDTQPCDRGRNRGVRNVLGVTGACLLISRKVFTEIGGFCEELPVAYNDADLCMRLNAEGLRCVLRNDVRLIHHESASRGDDTKDEEKKQRLYAELDKLNARNPLYAYSDPWDHEALSSESALYRPAFTGEDRLLPLCTRPESAAEKSFEPVNEALIISWERPRRDPRDGSLRISLHVHVRGWDNADYRFSLYLKGPGGAYRLPAFRRYRPDVEAAYDEQLHVELSGLAVRLAADALPAGDYELWVEAKSRISRQVLYRRAETLLHIGGK